MVLMVLNKHALTLVGLFCVVLVSGGVITQVGGQAGPQDLMMKNMYVTATVDTDCTGSLLIKSEVKNVGSEALNYFDMRIDIRSFNVTGASLNGSSADTAIIPESNYNLIRVMSASPIIAGSVVMLVLNLTTDCLQEQIGLNDDGTMYINHLIYYIRPLYEIHNLTFSAILPTHAVLETDAAAPLFPNPTMNFTDGFRHIYVWFRSQMLPGQEVAYIIKYQIPAAIIDAPSEQLNSFVLGIEFIAIGAIAVLFIERIPLIIKKLQTRTVIAPMRLSKQEEQVLDFLSKKGGSSPQREIYEELGFSQSLASTVLTSLEERGLIRRLREGRENIVHLMEE